MICFNFLSSQLRRGDTAVLLLPHVERRLADAHLAAHLVDARTQFVLLQRKGDLVLGELALPHDMLLALPGLRHAGRFCYQKVRNPGTGSRIAARLLQPLRLDIFLSKATPLIRGRGRLFMRRFLSTATPRHRSI